jgi:hypothetical protein
MGKGIDKSVNRIQNCHATAPAYHNKKSPGVQGGFGRKLWAPEI